MQKKYSFLLILLGIGLLPFSQQGIAQVLVGKTLCKLTVTTDSIMEPTCVGVNDGKANATTTPGTPPYTYAWAPGGQTNQIATGLSAGTYTVTVTDKAGCTGTATATITNPGYTINTIIGNGTFGTGGNGGPAPLAQVFPEAVAVDNTGNIYFVEPILYDVRKVNTAGIISIFAGNGFNGYSGDGGPATAAELNGPTGVAFDKSGNIYIADERNNVIRKVNTLGIITTFAGNGTAGYSGDTGPATAAEFNNPDEVALDAAGNVYVSDYSNEIVRVINTSGTINAFAGNTHSGVVGDGGPATAAEIESPQGIAVDSKGNVYFADTCRIRMVNTAGIISTFAGTLTEGFYGDGGPANVAEFNTPWGVAIDPMDNVYVTDLLNARVRFINKAGIISTIAGNGVAGYSGDGGPATAAELKCDEFEGVAVDGMANVYLAEAFVGRIRKLYSCSCAFTAGVVPGKPPCYGDTNGSATAIASSLFTPYSYFWFPHGNTGSSINDAKAGYATAFIKDANFCWALDSTPIISDPKITPIISGTAAICGGSPDVLTAGGGITYAWSTGATGNSITVTPTASQSYSVIVTDANSCHADTTFAIAVTNFNPMVSGSDSLCIGDVTTITASGGSTYVWSNGSTNQSITLSPIADTTISVIITSGICSDSINYPIIVGTSGALCAIKFYNGITPNGDGHNDDWVIDNIELFGTNTVDIYNRWGTLVWNASGYNNTTTVWKGNDTKGQPLPDGTYFYIVKVNSKTYNGWVQLTR